VTTDESNLAFGDYILEMCSKQICITAIRDRSVEHLEIRQSDDRTESFDMDILRSYILNEDWLTGPRNIGAEIKFIREYFDEINGIFSSENYPDIKVSLQNLKIERGKKMFPHWFKDA
jgi:hypothetical protein